MEGITLNNNYLKNLKHQARRLTSTLLSLITLFDEEEARLNRQDEVSRLEVFYSFISQLLDVTKRSEDSASYSQTKGDLISSLGIFTLGGIVKRVSKNKQLTAFADSLLESPTSKNLPFGLIRICIGLKGLPDDVRVVSISKLARESNRLESEIIHELEQRGCLLFSEDKFSLLINKLSDDVRKGRLCLPISRKNCLAFRYRASQSLELKR